MRAILVFFIIAAFLLAVFYSFTVFAHTPVEVEPIKCAFKNILVERLKKEFNEQPIGLGKSEQGALVVVFSSPKGDTWSIVTVRPDGWACIAAGGENWRQVTPTVESEEM